MRKNHFWMLAAILFCGFATVFTSCSKDDDDSGKKEEDTPTTTKVADRVEVKNYVAVADDMLQLFDITITDEGPNLGKNSRKLEKVLWIGGEVWENISTRTDKKAIFSLSVTVTPKAGVQVDATKNYLLGMETVLAYLIQTSKFETLDANGTRPNVTALSVSGSQLTEAKLKQLAEAYTGFGAKTLEVYKDYYVVDGEKRTY